jgi:hypothetical protein
MFNVAFFLPAALLCILLVSTAVFLFVGTDENFEPFDTQDIEEISTKNNRQNLEIIII